MSGTHSAPGGGKGRPGACHGTAQVVVGVPVAAGKLRASQPENGLDLSWRRALCQQRARDPEIHDAPVRLRKSSGDVPSPHPGLVDLAGLLCGDRHGTTPVHSRSSIEKDARKRAVRRWRGLSRRGPQQAVSTARQSRATIDDFHPRSGAARRTPRGLLIGETGEPAQVSPVGAGPVSPIGPRQLPPDGGSDCGLQGSGTNMHPGLQMTGAGLEHDTGFVPVGLHVREDRRIGMVQVDQDVAGVFGLRHRVGCIRRSPHGCARARIRGSPNSSTGPGSKVVRRGTASWLQGESDEPNTDHGAWPPTGGGQHAR